MTGFSSSAGSGGGVPFVLLDGEQNNSNLALTSELRWHIPSLLPLGIDFARRLHASGKCSTAFCLLLMYYLFDTVQSYGVAFVMSSLCFIPIGCVARRSDAENQRPCLTGRIENKTKNTQSDWRHD